MRFLWLLYTEMLNVPLNHAEGNSLLNVESSGEDEVQPRRAFSFLKLHNYQLESVVEGQWKLIRQKRFKKRDPILELYNRDQDPDEKVNILEKHPEMADLLLPEMEAHEHPDRTIKTERTVIDEELRRKLRALGYLK